MHATAPARTWNNIASNSVNDLSKPQQ